eukprot:15485778-Alexandrium_andersonii.AAC.1
MLFHPRRCESFWPRPDCSQTRPVWRRQRVARPPRVEHLTHSSPERKCSSEQWLLCGSSDNASGGA